MKAFTEARDRLGYPWPVLPEINNSNRIWEKYKLGHSGEQPYLVNAEGQILAVDPELDEIRILLNAAANCQLPRAQVGHPQHADPLRCFLLSR